MALTYITSAGDTADLIAWKHYSRQDGRVVEQLLDANPGLADHGPLLPAGLVVQLPTIDPQPVAKGIRLWD